MTTGQSSELRQDILNEVSEHLDSLISYCQSGDEELNNVCVRFQVEHAAAKAEYSLEMEGASERGEEFSAEYGEQHLKDAMKRMVQFAGSAARIILRRTLARKGKSGFPHIMPTTPPNHAGAMNNSFGSRVSTTGGTPSATALQQYPISPVTPTTFSSDSTEPEPQPQQQRWGRSSSVEDVSEGTESWVAVGANVMHSAVNILGLILLAHPACRQELQEFMLMNADLRLLDHIQEALGMDRETEVQFFAEGFRTMHLSLLSNLTHDNKSVCVAVGNNSRLMQLMLQSTRIDEDNPGMGEWAEFAIRNVCMNSSEAREFIKSLKVPTNVAAENLNHNRAQRAGRGSNTAGQSVSSTEEERESSSGGIPQRAPSSASSHTSRSSDAGSVSNSNVVVHQVTM